MQSNSKFATTDSATMSVNLKNDSENESCETNQGSGTPFATPEPKANSHTTINSRCDLHYPNFQDPPRIFNQQSNNSQIFRILTVLAYIVSVSMAAIILSIYYTFIWNPYEHLDSPSMVNRLTQNINSVPDTPLPLYAMDNANQSASYVSYVPNLSITADTTSSSFASTSSSLNPNGPLSSETPSINFYANFPSSSQSFMSRQSKFALPIAALMLSNSSNESSPVKTNNYLTFDKFSSSIHESVVNKSAINLP